MNVRELQHQWKKLDDLAEEIRTAPEREDREKTDEDRQNYVRVRNEASKLQKTIERVIKAEKVEAGIPLDEEEYRPEYNYTS